MNYGKISKLAQDSTVTADEVKEILLAYNIGKKPLAKLLSWGETTIIRYIEGDIPTSEYSQKLRQIKDDPNYYYDLLLKNQDKLTNVAFKKSKKAVLNIIMKSKINLIAQYIINRANGEITPKWVQGILFYSQVISLGTTGRELFEEECTESYNDMPYLNLYESMKKNGIKVIDINVDSISKKERDIIDCVYETFEWYGPKAIRAINAMESLDYITEGSLFTNKSIPMEVLKTEYTAIFEKYNVSHYRDFTVYTHKRLKEALAQNIIKRI